MIPGLSHILATLFCCLLIDHAIGTSTEYRMLLSWLSQSSSILGVNPAAFYHNMHYMANSVVIMVDWLNVYPSIHSYSHGSFQSNRYCM